jgi:hypothetical protein
MRVAITASAASTSSRPPSMRPSVVPTSSENVTVTAPGTDRSREFSAGSLPATVACASAGAAPPIARTAQAPSIPRTAEIRFLALARLRAGSTTATVMAPDPVSVVP